MGEWAVAYTDGSSRGNPGEAGIGVVILDSDGKAVREANRAIGTATNNSAEYAAILLALAEAKSLGFEKIEIRTDSELLACQLTGKYRIRNPRLLKAAVRCMSLLREFDEWKVTLVPREENGRADKLARAAIDNRKGQSG